MTILSSSGSYQGYPLQAVRFRRSPGFEPEYGTVTLDLKHVGGIELEERVAQWRPFAPGGEIPGPISIQAWFQLFRGQTVTKTALPAVNPPKGKIGNFGDLVLETRRVSGKGKPTKMVFTDIYLDDSGITELLEDLAKIREHKHGKILLPITDIRKLYRKVGWVLGDVNCRMRGWAWDPATIHHQRGKPKRPFSAQEVVLWLFAHLPGSPLVQFHKSTGGKNFSKEPPTNLHYRGEWAVDALEQLFERYGLTPALQPDNSYLVYRKGEKQVPDGKVPREVGNYVSASSLHLRYEKKSPEYVFRPYVVGVLGQKRVRRFTAAYVPCFQDVDGKVYRLEDIGKVWPGYSYLDILSQVFLGAEKSFRNVPPQPGAGANGHLHFLRRQIMRKCAFRMFAPAVLFAPNFQRAFLGLSTESGVSAPYMADSDFDRIPWLPAMDYAVYKTERGRFPDGLAQAFAAKGDFDELFLAAPTVRASRLEQGFFRNFGEIETYFKAMKKREKRAAEEIRKRKSEKLELLEGFGKTLQKAAVRAPGTFLNAQAQEKYLANLEGKIIDLDIDFKAALDALGVRIPLGKLVQTEMDDACYMALSRGPQLAQDIEALDAQAAEIEATVERKWQSSFEAFQKVYSTLGGVQAWFNSPWEIVEPGSYTFDERTGLVMLSQPAVLIDQPFVLDPTNALVIGAGHVEATFGYELKDNTTSDWTLPLYMIDPKDFTGQGQVSFIGMSRATPLKSSIERSANMRLYETEIGDPMNLTAVITDGLTKAKAQLQRPRKSVGYTYDFAGFEKMELDAGVDSIQYSFDGDVAGTFIAINSPGARGPMGQGKVGQEVKRGLDPDLAETIQTEIISMQLGGRS